MPHRLSLCPPATRSSAAVTKVGPGCNKIQSRRPRRRRLPGRLPDGTCPECKQGLRAVSAPTSSSPTTFPISTPAVVTYGGLLRQHRRHRAICPQGSLDPRSRRAAPLLWRRHHHLLPMPPLGESPKGQEGRCLSDSADWATWRQIRARSRSPPSVLFTTSPQQEGRRPSPASAPTRLLVFPQRRRDGQARRQASTSFWTPSPPITTSTRNLNLLRRDGNLLPGGRTRKTVCLSLPSVFSSARRSLSGRPSEASAETQENARLLWQTQHHRRQSKSSPSRRFNEAYDRPP